MYLKSLEISGFKSFKEKAHLEFSSPISAIVGPNGSGKSNIAEAFRFVLGEQSMKSLRGKKGEDLIFNGGRDVARANRAVVKVIFDNKDRALDLDFDEAAIERVVNRDGSNEYLINGSQVRLKDIQELLSGAHIGSTGHHIISQGQADKILNSTLKERKNMIEDALGLRVYHMKIHESNRRLEKTQENIHEVGSLRREIAPHIKFLAKQVEKIEATKAMKDDLIALYKTYFATEDEYVTFTRKTLDDKKRPLEDAIRKLEIRAEELKAILAEDDTNSDKTDALLALEAELSELERQKEEHNRTLGRLEGEINSQQRLIDNEKSRQDEHKTVSLGEIEQLSFEIEAMSMVDEIRQALKNFINKFKAGENTLDPQLEEDLKQLKTQVSQEEGVLGEISDKEKQLRDKRAEMQRTIEAEKDKDRDAERELFALLTDKNDLTATMSKIGLDEERLAIIDAEFKHEQGDAGTLLGRHAIDFKGVPAPTMTTEPDDITSIREAQARRKREIDRMKIKLEDEAAGSHEDILKEHKEVTGRDAFLMKELEDLEKSAASLNELIDDLKEKLETQFKDGIKKINIQLMEFFGMMFGGGKAALSIVEEEVRKKKDTDLDMDEDEMEEAAEADENPSGEMNVGVEVSVSLPRKNIKNMMMLSGGERALTSIALIFAMSQVNPPPFIILDETDAALDEANSKKYGDMVESLSKHSQLILITHNRETMSRAGILYGVTMGSTGISKLLSVKFDEAVAVAK